MRIPTLSMFVAALVGSAAPAGAAETAAAMPAGC